MQQRRDHQRLVVIASQVSAWEHQGKGIQYRRWGGGYMKLNRVGLRWSAMIRECRRKEVEGVLLLAEDMGYRYVCCRTPLRRE